MELIAVQAEADVVTLREAPSAGRTIPFASRSVQ